MTEGREQAEKLIYAAELAKILIQVHIPSWTFSWSSAALQMGCCHYKERKITLSHKLVRTASRELIQDTILHEIAHAMAGFQPAHGLAWKRVAWSLGCTGDRCYATTAVEAVQGKYTATCPGCQQVFHKHRAPGTRARWCVQCGRIKGSLTFVQS